VCLTMPAAYTRVYEVFNGERVISESAVYAVPRIIACSRVVYSARACEIGHGVED